MLPRDKRRQILCPFHSRAGSDTSRYRDSIRASQGKTDYDAKQKPGNPVAESSGLPPLAVSDPAKYRQQRLDELTAEVARLNQRWQGWSFTIPAYTYTNMDKTLNDVLKPVEKKTKTVNQHLKVSPVNTEKFPGGRVKFIVFRLLFFVV